ncbi:spermidine synthase [Haloarcula halophila]|uniref:spermidine synthase n=2 Tax=Haloarcula TaxID=2237 RepID=UPI00360CCB2E
MSQSATDSKNQMDSPDSPRRSTVTDRRFKLGLTVVVAFCSIAYELVYSQFLTVFYGGTVVRYSITIGLYMFSLGIGALLSGQLDDPESNLLRTEVYLSVAGPVGAGFIIALNSFPNVAFPGKYTVTLVAAHLPIIVVGVLSGFEIPLLDSLVEDREGSLFSAMGSLYPRRVVRRVMGLFFSVSDSEGRSLSEVLGADYIGSLLGTVVYALVLYPRLGLVVTVLVLGLLNALAALAFAAWTLTGRSETLSRPTVGNWRAVLVVGLLVTGTYGGLVANGDAVDRTVTGAYMGDRIADEYRPGSVEIDVQSYDTTAYQRVTMYERRVSTHAGPEQCLRLDSALQLCDSWVDSYHSGLVDVPMSMYDDQSSVDVLLVGGGDYIAVNHLRDYNVSVDQVDIDGEFLEYTKNRSYFEQFHDDAYEYDRLNTTVGDAYTYLRGTDKEYDLILLDVPGARSDDALPLYSQEFYTLLDQHLTDRGVVVSWVYSEYTYPQHNKAYHNTVAAAGFDRHLPYSVVEDLDGDGEYERGEQFYVLSDGPTPRPDLEHARGAYVRNNADRLGPFEWQRLATYRGIKPNSVFDPNYDIIVGYT